MKKLFFGFMIVFLLINVSVSAMMSDEDKECLQRGYEMVSGYYLISGGYEGILSNSDIYCLFPDRNYCLNSKFNNNTCGSKYKIENYCIKQGDPVWDIDKCCEGLEPYLPSSMDGHPSCQPFSVRFIGELKYNPFYWFIELVFVLFIVYLIHRLVKK